jgi:hypothetical protein
MKFPTREECSKAQTSTRLYEALTLYLMLHRRGDPS